jgi:hypothetical protein
MQSGFLFVETNARHPGMVRIRGAAQDPTPIGDGLRAGHGPRVRLVVRFLDLDAARMHAHTELRRRLIDADAGTYRASLVEAVAALDAIQLDHRLIYRDPDISTEDAAAIASLVRARHKQQAWQDKAWQIVGGLGIGLLVFFALAFNR